MKNERLKKASGDVTSTDPMVAFFYTLLRDHLSPGEVEQLVRDNIDLGEAHFSNGWLAAYAKYCVERLRE